MYKLRFISFYTRRDRIRFGPQLNESLLKLIRVGSIRRFFIVLMRVDHFSFAPRYYIKVRFSASAQRINCDGPVNLLPFRAELGPSGLASCRLKLPEKVASAAACFSAPEYSYGKTGQTAGNVFDSNGNYTAKSLRIPPVGSA